MVAALFSGLSRFYLNRGRGNRTMMVTTGRPIRACSSLLPVEADSSLVVIAFSFALSFLPPCGCRPSTLYKNQWLVPFSRRFLRLPCLCLCTGWLTRVVRCWSCRRGAGRAVWSDVPFLTRPRRVTDATCPEGDAVILCITWWAFPRFALRWARRNGASATLPCLTARPLRILVSCLGCRGGSCS